VGEPQPGLHLIPQVFNPENLSLAVDPSAVSENGQIYGLTNREIEIGLQF
jgi:hypothetical protein